MLLFHIVILALVQGITEFLPISSSGHLLLAHEMLGHDATAAFTDNLTLDIAVHVGTLAAVMVYFRKDILSILQGIFMPGKTDSANDTQIAGRRLALYIIAGSLPVIIAGFGLYLWAPLWLRSLEITAWMTLIFGLVLGVTDKFSPTDKSFAHLNLKHVLLIGLSQILALIPGTSRSGITMTAARACGFDRTAAARFSLLLAIVAISGAGFLNGLDLWHSPDTRFTMDIFLAAVFSFIAGWTAIALMMKWLARASFLPFVIYRVILGLALLGFVYM